MLTAAHARGLILVAIASSPCVQKTPDDTVTTNPSLSAEQICNATPTTCESDTLTVRHPVADTCHDWYTIPCFPYACEAEGLSCRARCDTNNDCSGGAVCTSGGICTVNVPYCGPLCDGDAEVVQRYDNGACARDYVVPCFPYTCDGGDGRCSTSCVTATDCAAGATCDVNGLCVPHGSSCMDDATIRDNDGTVTSCAPYRCQSGACTSWCLSGSDCGPNSRCDVTAQRCIPTG